ncbi:para-aminobenzoate synthase [Agrocybe pediades]|nr:para-aminobenzoate synthase [Agrocybe pediades]
MIADSPKLLLIDSYDSFTHNLAALCRQAIPNASISIIKNDDFKIEDLRPFLPYFSAIVIGPGPGSPDIAEDIGVVRDLWKLQDNELLPIFGVCLGLQSLAIEHGAQLRRLGTVKHGLISTVHHLADDLFENVGTVKAVRYHSLHVEVDGLDDIAELAHAVDEENGKVVMAIRHKHRPFWAVQYHPESVCTEGGGVEVVANFWRLAQAWSKEFGRRPAQWQHTPSCVIGKSWPYPSRITPLSSPLERPGVVYAALKRSDVDIVDMCEAFNVSNNSTRFALLESASHPGRYSIIGCLSDSTLQIQFRVGDTYVSLTRDGITTLEGLGSLDIWQWLAKYMQTKSVSGGYPGIPFWGGLIGYLGYELGVHSMHVPLRRDGTNPENKHSDLNLLFVERSVVVDQKAGQTFVQSILPGDRAWVSETVAKLESLSTTKNTKDSSLYCGKMSIKFPDKEKYISNICKAKEHLYAGDSYELCLTAQTRISVPSSSASDTRSSTSWERYKRLRKANPAPHSAYLRLHPTTLLSSSPERFVSFSRLPGTVCQLRPIKGTIRKGPLVTRAVAEKALVGNPKEVAENLMIVDLIRHDLHGVVGEDVVVKQFCSLEEYETVWQLVSVIEGKVTGDAALFSGAEDQLGWQVLKESLPPGSMTGAPKKRSVEILQQLEGEERGIYSGVFGYWCVSGAGDWSVTIRSCFKYEEDQDGDRLNAPEEWIIGAGGAITALSDPESEWEEMVTKLQSVLRAFGALSTDSI